MKKFFIASIVGALIVFVWSFLSWEFLPVHTHSFHYSPKQDTIMNAITKSGLEPGAYMMPTVDNRGTGLFDSKYSDAMMEFQKTNAGKPFAMIIYDKGMVMSPMQPVIGIIIDLLAVMCVVIILTLAKDRLKTFFMRWWIVMIVGFVVALNSYMLELIWMQFPWHFIKGEIIDTFMEWGLCGAWLAWYFRKV
jgi:hypothetical protein